MKKLLAISLCSLPLAMGSTVFAQGGTTTPENRLPMEESADSSKNMGATVDGTRDNDRDRTRNMDRDNDRMSGTAGTTGTTGATGTTGTTGTGMDRNRTETKESITAGPDRTGDATGTGSLGKTDGTGTGTAPGVDE